MPSSILHRRPVRFAKVLLAVAVTGALVLPATPSSAVTFAEPVGPVPVVVPAATDTVPAATDTAPAATDTAPAATSFARTIRRGRAAANAALQETGASSISLALVSGQKVVWRQAFGAVDQQGTRPGLDMAYGIGSVSKTLTAIAVMQLVDAGRVSLDAPVVNFVPDFRMADPAYRQITVRMLLNHSAGLPGADYLNMLTAAPFAGYADQVLQSLRTQRLKSSPGSFSVYCNDCYTLAGILVERVSGLPYAQYMQDEVFAPLGMTETVMDTASFPAGTWAPVVGEDGPLPQEFINALASGGIWSTPSDMSHVAQMLLAEGVYDRERFLSSSSVQQMGTLQLPTTLDPVVQQNWQYGMGWDTVAEPGLADVGVTAWKKGGDTVAYHSSFIVAPEPGLAVTVLGAGPTFSSTAAANLGQSILLNALVDKGDIDALPPVLGDSTKARRSPTRKQVRAVVGTYLSQPGNVRVTANGNDTLSIAVLVDGEWSPRPGRYSLRSDGSFWFGPKSIRTVRGWGNTYLVQRQPDGRGHYRVDAVVGQRVGPGAATSSAWQARTGTPWLLANGLPDSIDWAVPARPLEPIPGLPGYVHLDVGTAPVDVSGSEVLGAMFLLIPGLVGRDLMDLDMFAHAGEEWMRAGAYVLRPAVGVPALAAGANAVPVASEGYAQWRTVPSSGRLDVQGASSWKLYGPDFAPLAAGSGAASGVDAPSGAYVVVFGAPSTVATVTLA